MGDKEFFSEGEFAFIMDEARKLFAKRTVSEDGLPLHEQFSALQTEFIKCLAEAAYFCGQEGW